MKETVPDRQGIALVALFVIGNSFIYGLAWRAGRDLWLASLLAITLALPLIAIYARVHSLSHGLPLNEALECLLGKWISRIVALSYSFYAWRLGCYVIGDLTGFIKAASLTGTPQVATAFGFALLALWAVKSGTETLAIWSSIMLPIVILILLMVVLLMLSQADFSRFKPLMYDGFKPVFLGALQVLDFPILETILLFWVLGDLNQKKSSYKVLLSGVLGASLFLLITASVSFSILGVDKYLASYFPIFLAAARIDLASFLTRFEVVVGITFAIGGFLKIAVCLLAASKALAAALGSSNYRYLATPLVLGAIAGSQWFVQTTLDMEMSATKVVSAADLAMQVIIPVSFWIIIEIRLLRKKSKAGKLGGI